VWNGWKGQLLRDLYFEADTLMSGGDAARARMDRVGEAKAALVGRIADFNEKSRARALSRPPDAYWLAFDAERHEQHARLIEAADAANEPVAVAATNDAFQSISEIVVYTRDRPGLFSLLTGTIAVSRGSIVDARIFTTADGYALDVFRVQDTDGKPFGDEARIERLKRAIARTLKNDQPLRAALAKHPPKSRVRAFRVAPRVHLDNEASNAATVIEVQAQDRPGLLYDVTSALFDAGLSISSAVIATYGERAVDVFYVRDAFGHKLPHPARRAAVEELLLKALGGGEP